MISAEELSKLYYKTYPDFLHDKLIKQTTEIEERLEKELKEAFPDQFLNFYITLSSADLNIWWDREGTRLIDKLKSLNYKIHSSKERRNDEDIVILNISWE